MPPSLAPRPRHPGGATTRYVLVLALTVGAAACGGTPQGDGAGGGAAAEGTAASAPSPGPEGTESPEGTDAGVSPEPAVALPTIPAEAGHVHGLSVQPDGLVHLGTHRGLMVLDPDDPAAGVKTVGTSTVDLMGFAAGGPDRLVASGHPGPADDLPNPVGLIESTDGGQSWRALSRQGTSDFHTLAAGAGRVYGFDGALRWTDDGTSWTTSPAELRPASLAVHPEQAGTVVATTEQGPLRSTDDATTFSPLPDAPLLVLLAWPAPEELWAIDPAGGLHLSADGGTTWQARGQVGEAPEALGAAPDGVVVVSTATGLVRSVDGARTFAPVAGRG